MSHTLTFESVVMDQRALVRALVRIGVSESCIEVHEEPVPMRNYHENEETKANVIVRRKVFAGSRNSDIGWERTDEGTFVAHIDSYNYGDATHFSEAWQQRLYTYYNVEATKIAFEKEGLEYTETTDTDGRIQLRAKFKAAPVKTNKIKVHS